MTTDVSGIVRHEVMPVVSEIDRLIFGLDDVFSMEMEAEDDVRTKLVRDSAIKQAAACDLFGRYLDRCQFDPTTIEVVADLDGLPQLPTTAFKRRLITSVGDERQVKWCRSSGTLGSVSEVPRDDTTLLRLFGSVSAALRALGEPWHEDELAVVNLGPPKADAGDLWFAYVMSLTEYLYPTVHCVSDEQLRIGRAEEALRAFLSDGRNVALVGPPVLMHDLAMHLALNERAISAGDRLTVLTAGGWKRHDRGALDRPDFDALMMKAFGLTSPSQARDAFNQVELNTVIVECVERRKHVPPWLHVCVRDPQTLERIPDGQLGLLSYLDPTAESYPCFIISDDIGTLVELTCPCGRQSRVMEIRRRITREESFGCAPRMAAYLGGDP